jgi:hypothetical protein
MMRINIFLNNGVVPTRSSLGFSINSCVRYFSLTSVKLSGRDCENSLPERQKIHLKKYIKMYEDEWKLPYLDDKDGVITKMNNEKAVDLAAAYIDNLEGLNERKQDAIKVFKKVQEDFDDHFTEKFEYAIREFNKERSKNGKPSVCEESILEYLWKIHQDKEKVRYELIPNQEDKAFSSLSKEVYNLYKKVKTTHNRAENLINKNSSSHITKNGDPNVIDKDFFKKDLKVVWDNIKYSDSSSDTNNPPVATSTPSNLTEVRKRSIEESEGHSEDYPNKRVKTDSTSYLDVVLDKDDIDKSKGSNVQNKNENKSIMDLVNEKNPFKIQSNASQTNTSKTGENSIMDHVNENNQFKSRSNSSQTDKELKYNPVNSNNTFKKDSKESILDIKNSDHDGELLQSKMTFKMSDISFDFSNINIFSLKIPRIEVPSLNFEVLMCSINMNIEWGWIIIVIKVIYTRILFYGIPLWCYCVWRSVSRIIDYILNPIRKK